MVTSDFRAELELWPFCAFAVKNTQYNPYLWPNVAEIFTSQEIGVEKLDGDVRFYTKWKYGRFAHAPRKMCNITLIYSPIAKIFAEHRKSGYRKTTVTSDFRPEVEL